MSTAPAHASSLLRAAARALTPLQRITALLEIPPRRLAAAVVAAVATLASAFALAAVSAWLVTTAWTMPPVLDLSVAVVTVRALGVSRGVFRWVDRMLTHDAALRGVVSLRTNLFTALATRPGDAVTRLRRGDLLARLGDDAQEMAEHVIRAVVPVIVAAVMAVLVVATIAPISLLAATAMLASLALASLLAPWAAYRAARLTHDAVITTRGEVTAGAVSILEDATALRLDGRLDTALAAAAERQREHDAAIDRAALPSALAAAAVPASMTLAVLGSVLAAGALWTGGGVSAGQIGILLLVPLSAFEAASALPDAAAQLARSRAAAARLDDAIGGQDALRRVAEAQAQETGAIAAPAAGDLPLVPRLRAEQLDVGWSASAVRVRGLDLDLEPGTRLAVIGPSGAGKSTLLATLAGLLDPVSGRVLLDGTDVRDIEPDTVRAAVTMFAEDAHVFGTSIVENLRVVRGDITADEANAALRAVGLDGWGASLPAGLDTVLGADGTTISGGERRRLLLARLVLRPAGIVLVDEPTEHLDSRSGDDLLRALLTPGDETLVSATSTVVAVTHRVEAIPPGTPVLRIVPGAAPVREEAT